MAYCVYLTSYKGNLLPPFYIGSTSLKKIQNGYNGSVKSRKYFSIFTKERRENPHLFKTQIVSLHTTRKEAVEKEYKLQVQLNVVKSSMYFNEAIAAPNGCNGRDTKGILAPFYGRKHSEETKEKMRKPKRDSTKMRKPKSNSHRKKIAATARDNAIAGREKIRQSKLGKRRIYREDGSFYMGFIS